MSNQELQQLPTEQDKINSELVKFDKYQARLEELKKQYAGLKIVDIDDKEGYETVKEAVATLRTMRSETEKDRKDAKDFYLRAGREIDGKAEFIKTGILSIENPLKKRKDEIDEEREAEKKRKQEEENNRYTQRTADLTKMGVLFSDGYFVLDGVEYEASLIKGCDDETYLKMYNAFKEKYDVIEAERLAAEEKRQAEQKELDDLRKQKEEFEAFKKQQADTLYQTRALQLPETIIEGDDIRDKLTTRLYLRRETILSLTNEEFDKEVKARQETVDNHFKQLEEAKAEEERKKQAAIELFNTRLAMLPDAATKGKTIIHTKFQNVFLWMDALDTKSEKDFLKTVELWNNGIKEAEQAEIEAEEQRKKDLKTAEDAAAKKALKDKEEADRLAEENRKEQLAAASDKEKWSHIMEQLKGIEIPEFKSNQYKAKAQTLKQKLNDLTK